MFHVKYNFVKNMTRIISRTSWRNTGMLLCTHFDAFSKLIKIWTREITIQKCKEQNESEVAKFHLKTQFPKYVHWDKSIENYFFNNMLIFLLFFSKVQTISCLIFFLLLQLLIDKSVNFKLSTEFLFSKCPEYSGFKILKSESLVRNWA